MCNTHRHINTITSALQCCTRITHRSTSAASELFGCCGALQKPDNHLSNTIHRAQQGCDNNVASVKSKLSHRLGEMGLPHSECFFQPVHGSFHQPSAVCSWTKLAWRSHQHPLSHGSMKEIVLISQVVSFQHLEKAIRKRIPSVSGVGVFARTSLSLESNLSHTQSVYNVYT